MPKTTEDIKESRAKYDTYSIVEWIKAGFDEESGG